MFSFLDRYPGILSFEVILKETVVPYTMVFFLQNCIFIF
jgi:hypothetical protein